MLVIYIFFVCLHLILRIFALVLPFLRFSKTKLIFAFALGMRCFSLYTTSNVVYTRKVLFYSKYDRLFSDYWNSIIKLSCECTLISHSKVPSTQYSIHILSKRSNILRIYAIYAIVFTSCKKKLYFISTKLYYITTSVDR